ncbi:MAG TPA: twin-arginine translocase TatA/TatE family subunit [bacterium]|nr:twin-arginine translocase TatA/TatE family subunit [bacterium]HXB98214.1 twin-arginine translocase TatA/TatE family subunit [bacterium]
MPDFSLPELIVIFLIFLLLFGGGKLPEAGRSLGSAIREFRNAMREADPTKDVKAAKTIDAEKKSDEGKSTQA